MAPIQSVRGVAFDVGPRYRLRSKLGQGAFGHVCSAWDTHAETWVALKKIPKAFDDAHSCKLVLRELVLMRHFAAHENM